MPDPNDSLIDRAVERADRGESGSTIQDTRREMVRTDIPRPDAGPSMVQRLLTTFRGRRPERDDSRSDSRR